LHLARKTSFIRAMTELTPDTETAGGLRLLPSKLRAYALLARLDRPIGIWLLFLPGLWGILLARPPIAETYRLILLFALGSVLMRGAGCVVNDLWDRDLDRAVARTRARPLAAGLLSTRQALGFLLILLTLSLFILLSLNRTAQIMGVVSLLPVALYPLAKRVTNWPQIVLGFTFGFGAPLGFIAAGGHFSLAFFAIYAAAILWDLYFDTIYAHQDREDDAIAGIGSSALALGRHTRLFMIVLVAVLVGLLALAGHAQARGTLFYAALLLPAAMFAYQLQQLNIDDPRNCLRLFRLNREAGLLVALALALG
jgi:4-hydroxybenzoate polyprenyltransferase